LRRYARSLKDKNGIGNTTVVEQAVCVCVGRGGVVMEGGAGAPGPLWGLGVLRPTA